MYRKDSTGWIKHVDFIILDLICLQVAFVLAYALSGYGVNPYQLILYRNMAVVMEVADLVVLFAMGTLKNVLKRGYYKDFVVTAQHGVILGACLLLYLFMLQEGHEYSRLALILNIVTDSNLNHTGIYLYSKGKIMIHLTFDYKTDEKCTTPGQYLKYHRTFQGLSTRELAEKVGIVPATLVLYENDRHPIKHSTAVALANALGIDRNRLLDKYTAFVDYPYSSLLKKVRQDLSLTQIQMAELIGIGQTSYSGWEREIRVPRRKEYDKILAALEKLRVNVDTYLCQSASI